MKVPMPHMKQRKEWTEALTQAIDLTNRAGDTRNAYRLTDLLSRVVARPSVAPVRWMFEHVSASGKRHFTYHDETPQNHYQTAYRDTCVMVTPLYAAPPDPWKDAVTDECTRAGIGWGDADPRETIQKLVQWHVRLALAPSPTSAGALPGTTRIVTSPEMIPEHPNLATAPRPRTTWVHTSGRVYTVLAITNQHSDDFEKFPRMVVYEGINGRVWSRPVHDWSRSFTPQEVVA